MFRSDGTKRHSDSEHAEREATLRRERHEVLREVEAEAKEDKAKLERETRALEGGDPTTLLSADELDEQTRSGIRL